VAEEVFVAETGICWFAGDVIWGEERPFAPWEKGLRLATAGRLMYADGGEFRRCYCRRGRRGGSSPSGAEKTAVVQGRKFRSAEIRREKKRGDAIGFEGELLVVRE